VLSCGMRRLIGLKNFVHDAIELTTNLVQETHESVSKKPLQALNAIPIPELNEAAQAVDKVRHGIANFVFDSIRATNEGVRAIEDAGIAAVTSALGQDAIEAPLEKIAETLVTPMRSDAMGSPGWLIDSAQGVLNAAMGDFLGAKNNPLSIEMGIYQGGRPVSPDEWADSLGDGDRSDTLVVFVHGLGCTEWSWSFGAKELHGDPATNFGTLLGKDFGFTSLYVRYNSGLHVSENGRRLSSLLERIVEAHGASRIILVGHSMGGLVVRSAAHYGKSEDAWWSRRLTHVFCIAAPHLGAPLEKAGNVVASVLKLFDAAGAQVPARIINGRSSGIKDLRFGYVVDEDWKDREPDALLEDNRQNVPFCDGVLYCISASHLATDPDHPVSQILGDVLVRIPSARGEHPDQTRCIPFHIGHTVGGINHLGLANHPDVYEQIAAVLRMDDVAPAAEA
jgi:triacylglycerol lipase